MKLTGIILAAASMMLWTAAVFTQEAGSIPDTTRTEPRENGRTETPVDEAGKKSPRQRDTVSGDRNFHNWNQWQWPLVSGIARDMLKLSLGLAQTNELRSSSLYLAGEFEFMVNDRFGVAGEGSIPVAAGFDDFSVYHAVIGGNIHLFPYSPVDLYLGGKGGFFYIDPATGPQKWSPAIGLHGGLSYYFWGTFFVQLESGYFISEYAAEGFYTSFYHLRNSFKVGIFF